MIEISPARRRELRALAHHLDAVVSIAGNGLTASVLNEIDTALNAHELIKIRVFGDDRALRQHYMAEICSHTGASPVQSIGKLLVIWRQAPPREAPAPRARVGKPLTKRAAQLAAEGITRRSPRAARKAPSAAGAKKAAPRSRNARGH